MTGALRVLSVRLTSLPLKKERLRLIPMANQHPQVRTLVQQSFFSGTIAAIAMMPVGALFTLQGLRINEYGMKVIQTFFGTLPPFARFGLFAVEHFVISWTVAVPLLLLLQRFSGHIHGLLIGLVYGGAFYLLINALALPIIFRDPTPFVLGFAVIYPSLIVHLVYGATIWYTSRAFAAHKVQTELRLNPVL